MWTPSGEWSEEEQSLRKEADLGGKKAKTTLVLYNLLTLARCWTYWRSKSNLWDEQMDETKSSTSREPET